MYFNFIVILLLLSLNKVHPPFQTLDPPLGVVCVPGGRLWQWNVTWKLLKDIYGGKILYDRSMGMYFYNKTFTMLLK